MTGLRNALADLLLFAALMAIIGHEDHVGLLLLAAAAVFQRTAQLFADTRPESAAA